MAIGIALQLYTLREPAAKDLAKTLKRVKETGFDYVQWSGMPNLPAEEIRAQLDHAGLKAIAGHSAIEPFENDFHAALKHWKTIGVRDLAPGGMMADCLDPLEAWLRGAARLDAVGARLKVEGIRLSYHNHASELETFPADTRRKLDILYQAASPENLFAELDTAWLQVGGVDPAGYIRKYKNRCPVIHVKDLVAMPEKNGRVEFPPLGQGILDWPAIFSAAKESGVEWYIYEQDPCQGDPFDSVRISYQFLKDNL